MAFTGGTTNAVQFTKLMSVSPAKEVGANFYGGRLRAFNDIITMTTDAKSTNIGFGYLPPGAVPLWGVLINDTSLGSAVVGVGIVGALAKYRVGAVKTSVTPEVFMVTAAFGVELTAAEEVLITNDATAALPASGILGLAMVYCSNN